MNEPSIQELTPREVQALLQSSEPPLLLDVRQPEEHEFVALPDSILIPLGTLPGRVAALDKSREIVVYCHHGIRSMTAVQFMAENGFARLINLAGGIDAWSRQVDPTLPRY